MKKILDYKYTILAIIVFIALGLRPMIELVVYVWTGSSSWTGDQAFMGALTVPLSLVGIISGVAVDEDKRAK